MNRVYLLAACLSTTEFLSAIRKTIRCGVHIHFHVQSDLSREVGWIAPCARHSDGAPHLRRPYSILEVVSPLALIFYVIKILYAFYPGPVSSFPRIGVTENRSFWTLSALSIMVIHILRISTFTTSFNNLRRWFLIKGYNYLDLSCTARHPCGVWLPWVLSRS